MAQLMSVTLRAHTVNFSAPFMMILSHGKNDDDIKFLCFFIDKNVAFQEAESLALAVDGAVHDSFDAVVEQLFRLNKEAFTSKSLAEFKRARSEPRPTKGDDTTIVSLLNYINLVRDMLENGTLKNKDYIDEFTKKLGLPFDPDFFLLEIKAGFIEEIGPVEGMDKLFCEQVRADRTYTICSGLREHYAAEALVKGTFLFVLNIKKAKFRGLESEGMICCTKEAEKVEAIAVHAGASSRLSLEGMLDIFGGLTYGKIDLKKSKYHDALESFKIIDHHLTFKGTKVLCGGEYVKTKIANGPVS